MTTRRFPAQIACSRCDATFAIRELMNLCPHDGAPLLVRYDIAKSPELRDEIRTRPATMWRYRELLPIDDESEIVTLGEGITPLLKSKNFENVWIKDESKNPTRSFKSRGMAAAVTMARRLGARSLAAPTAGNAGAALSAYGARAGLPVFVAMPRDTPQSIVDECRGYGAQVELVAGVITDAGKRVAQYIAENGGFDLSTLKEPYRVEGKKIMGYELLEDLGRLPDVILYPTGGGTGLIGMWKAFDEMEQLGWIGPERPKMVTVQAAGCAPIVQAWEAGKSASEMWADAATFAAGLRVPKPYGDYLILDIIRKSGGTAIAATDDEILDAVRHWASVEGVFAAPEGAAALVAYQKLREFGFFTADDTVVLFNTGTAYKYLDMMEAKRRTIRPEPPASRNIGGIIGPF